MEAAQIQIETRFAVTREEPWPPPERAIGCMPKSLRRKGKEHPFRLFRILAYFVESAGASTEII
jgi:hypothetical protein